MNNFDDDDNDVMMVSDSNTMYKATMMISITITVTTIM